MSAKCNFEEDIRLYGAGDIVRLRNGLVIGPIRSVAGGQLLDVLSTRFTWRANGTVPGEAPGHHHDIVDTVGLLPEDEIEVAAAEADRQALKEK